MAAVSIVCKTPSIGGQKPRLRPLLGIEMAAPLSACIIRGVAAALEALPVALGRRFYAVLTPEGSEAALRPLLPPHWALVGRQGAKVGAVLDARTTAFLADWHDCAIVVNADSPALPTAFVAQAIAALLAPGDRVGVNGHEPAVDFAKVQAHVHGVIAAIAPHDNVERFEGLGVTVIQSAARFTGPEEMEAGGQRIRARRFVIATGSSAAIPPVPGLAEVPFLTNETVFGLTERPDHLLVLGGGPIGVELAQAFRRLGADRSQRRRSDRPPAIRPEKPGVVNTLLRFLICPVIRVRRSRLLPAQLPDPIWYFAYGSNMNERLFRERRHMVWREARIGRISDYRLVFSRAGGMRPGVSAPANIVEAPGQAVHGVLYLLPLRKFLRLDNSEGRQYGYLWTEAEDMARNRLPVATFKVPHAAPEDQPGQRYLDLIREAARQRCLPADYLAMLDRVEPRP